MLALKTLLSRYGDEKDVPSGLKGVLVVSTFLPVKKNDRV
jgi:hypothetical protein